MRLELNDEQAFLRDTMRGSLERASDIAAVRRAGPGGFGPDVWDACVKLGLPMMCLPEHLGGGGAGALEALIVAVELGRTISPVPMVEHWASSRLVASLFPPAVFREVYGDPAPLAIALRPAVNDVWQLVPGGAVAQAVVGVSSDQVTLARVEPVDCGPTHASTPVADCRIGEVLAKVPLLECGLAWRKSMDEWRVFTAGLLVGVASRSLEIAVEYAVERWQFGRPIGSFQAIQHALADLVAPIDGAWLLASEAAWACDRWSGERRERLASMAFLFSASTARDATSVGVHVLGGYGVMEEYDIQLYYRRARGWPMVLGDPELERLSLADGLFGVAGRTA